jgi:hypothetical protein
MNGSQRDAADRSTVRGGAEQVPGGSLNRLNIGRLHAEFTGLTCAGSFTGIARR